MIGLKPDLFPLEENFSQSIAVSFHSSFRLTYKNLKKWIDRYSQTFDEAILGDLVLFYSLAKKKYLDHREARHLTRLILSIYQIQKKLISSSTLFSSSRHLFVRWMPTNLMFPFSSKPVLGCLIGFNIMDRCELFDEENILFSLQKHFPNLQLVKESYYKHSSPNENIRICYFEIEKKDGVPFSLQEKKFIYSNFQNKIKNSIQRLIPSMFMKLNQEEIYKNILILSQEITSINDLPQVYITLDQHTGKEIAFHITMVQVSPFHRFSFHERILECPIILERILPVKNFEGHQIEAALFKLLLPYEASLIRSDGSLDFYAARQKVTHLLTLAIGEFRDYNGGLLIKQQELLFSFKEILPDFANEDPELIETFFHALVPLEKQALLDPVVLSVLYTLFIQNKHAKMHEKVSLKIVQENQKTYILVRSLDPSITEVLVHIIQNRISSTKDWAYNILETGEEVYFNCVLLNPSSIDADAFVEGLEKGIQEWELKRQNKQVLRIALGHSMFSLDPRIGGENVSSEVLKLLFEGLTRINQNGHVENAVAESIKISPDLKQYTFKLRPSFWNDGSIVSAHDFAYSWKRILSPDFKTNFASFFYPIKNAKEAKEGKVNTNQIGVKVIDDRTLQIDLVRPTPYFLQLTTLPIFSPIHRFVDQERPQWPYQADIHYPCNGPFQLKLNQPNQAYQLVKNPIYWDAVHTKLDEITLTSMDTFQATQAFMKNEIDWIGDPFSAWQSSTLPEGGQVVGLGNNVLCWLIFNTMMGSVSNPKIRKALSLCIDRKSLVSDVAHPWTPAFSVTFPHVRGHEHKVYADHDEELALKLMHEGLNEIGLKQSNFSIQITYAHKSILEAAAIKIKQQIEKKLQIECHLQSFSWNNLFHKMCEGQFQIVLLSWTTPINDPIGMLNIFKFSKEGLNFSRWEDPQFQHLLNLSEEEINPFQRSSYLLKAEEILASATPVYPLFYQQETAFIRKNLHINNQHASAGFINLARTFYKRR